MGRSKWTPDVALTYGLNGQSLTAVVSANNYTAEPKVCGQLRTHIYNV